MRRLAFAAAVLLALPLWASAETYDQLRREYPVVDQAISRLPSGSIKGSLHRISSLLEQHRVAPIPAGAGASLPAGFDRQMTSALEQLDRDLLRGLPSLEIADRLIIAQVASQVAFVRNVELPVGPGGIAVLDRIADDIAASVRQGLVDWEQRTGLRATSARASADVDPSAQSFRTWVQFVVVDSLYIPGVESIDGRS